MLVALVAIIEIVRMQVSLLDIREEVGKEACSALKKEFSVDSVKFIHVDVTNGDQLVYLFCA